MKGVIDEGKEISPMFPRLHVKDAEKGGPKAPPRNKMALYEQFSIPSHGYTTGSGTTSLFPLPLRNCTVPPTSSHVSQVGSSQSIQFCTSNAPSILYEKTQAYNSRKVDLTKLTLDNFINSKNSLRTLDGTEDAFISGSAHGKSSCCGIFQKDKDEDKLARCDLSCSLKNLNSFRKAVNSLGVIELKSAQNGKNHMEEHTDVVQNGQKEEEEGPLLSLDGSDEMTNASSNSLVKGRNFKSMKKEHRSLLREEIRSISGDNLKTLQGRNGHTHEDHAALGDKINLRDHWMEKSVASDVQKGLGGLEISRTRCFLGKRDGNNDDETCRSHEALNKPSSECRFGVDFSPDDVVGVIGEKQFWKARKTIINQQKIFVMQVFELHRLIKVQRLIAGSPHLLLEDSLVLNKPPLKTSTPKKSQSDLVSEQQPSTVFKLDSKSEKATTTAEHVKNNAVGKIPLPCVNYISKGHSNEVSSYVHHLGNLATLVSEDIINSKQSPSFVYPPPGNQWLFPVMSPSEGLVYKPIIGPCPPNAAGIMAPPIYGAMSFNPGSNKDVVLDALAPIGSHNQKIGILSGGSSLPQFLPPCVPPPSFMHPSISASSNGPENHHSCGEVTSAILYQSSSNMSSKMSQVMPSRNVSTYHSLEDNNKEQLHQRSTASSPSKRMKGDELPLFPMAPTFWPPQPSADRDSHAHHHHPRVIKAFPHNPKSASESAARIFKSIQEERKRL